jgi:hypothetical protein
MTIPQVTARLPEPTPTISFKIRVDIDGQLTTLNRMEGTYRIAFRPRAGQKVLTLRGAMPREATAHQPICADIDGISLRATVRVEAHDRKRPETVMPLHNPAGPIGRTGQLKARRARAAPDQDAVTRRQHAPGHESTGVHAAAGGTDTAVPAASSNDCISAANLCGLIPGSGRLPAYANSG